MTEPDAVAHARAHQVELYGAPLGDLVRRLTSTLDLSQAAVGRLLGVSAPMLSQLVRGHRIKLGNPLAVQRLQALLDLCDDVADGMGPDAVQTRLAQIAATPATTLTQRRPDHGGPGSVSTLLRAVASGRDLAAAADVLRTTHPALADVLRIYGTGTDEEAARHWDGLAHLLER